MRDGCQLDTLPSSVATATIHRRRRTVRSSAFDTKLYGGQSYERLQRWIFDHIAHDRSSVHPLEVSAVSDCAPPKSLLTLRPCDGFARTASDSGFGSEGHLRRPVVEMASSIRADFSLQRETAVALHRTICGTAWGDDASERWWFQELTLGSAGLGVASDHHRAACGQQCQRVEREYEQPHERAEYWNVVQSTRSNQCENR